MRFYRPKHYLYVFICLLCCPPFGKAIAQSIPMEKEGLTPADLVYPFLDTENSRWFFFSSACRPFGMVNLSPDTQTGGAWGSGYRYKTDTIKGFSHIHAWQLAGLSVMPVSLEGPDTNTIFTDYYSKFSHATEKVSPGYHSLVLQRYGIDVALTSTTRVGFHQYHYPEEGQAAILFNLNGRLGPCKIMDAELEQLDDKHLKGKLINAPTVRRPRPSPVFFQIHLNTPVKSLIRDEATGNYLLILAGPQEQPVLMKAALSYTSAENAAKNLEAELPHWDFDRVVSESKNEWNRLLGRIEVKGATQTDRRRFYTDLWHALQGRRIISDVNGAYPDRTGEAFRIGQIPLDENQNPTFNHYNSDSFWGAQWTLNTLWGLVYPEIYEEFVHSLMQYYQDGGRVPRGPSGGNYTYVMTGATATPFIVSAVRKGIIRENVDEIYQALKKGHMEGGIMAKAGYEHTTNIGGGLSHYLSKGYVPYPLPEGKGFGYHQDGAGQTLEYAFQDWTLAQLAKKLGNQEDFDYFSKRSQNYRNVFDPGTGWVRPKDENGEWMPNFDPYHHGQGFVEANSAQTTWFAPHDIPGLAALMGGKEAATEKLNQQFKTAAKLGFTSGNAHDQETREEYSRIPINYGNQPSIQTAFVFHHLERPDLSQYWSRQVVEKAFSGFSTNSGYNGDEDQGLMGSLAVLMKIGLFQLEAGTDEKARYQIGSPIFDQITIQLNPDYYSGKELVIRTMGNTSENNRVKIARFEGKELTGAEIDHTALSQGGELMLEMSNDTE